MGTNNIKAKKRLSLVLVIITAPLLPLCAYCWVSPTNSETLKILHGLVILFGPGLFCAAVMYRMKQCDLAYSAEKAAKEQAVAREKLDQVTIKTWLQKCKVFIGNNNIPNCGPWIPTLLEDLRLGYEVTPNEAVEAIDKTIAGIDKSRYCISILITARQKINDLDRNG